MRSFLGRDILSLKDFERMEYFRVFQVCEDLKPYARDRRNGDLLKEKTLVTAFYQPSTRTRLATEAAMRGTARRRERSGQHGFHSALPVSDLSIKDTFHML